MTERTRSAQYGSGRPVLPDGNGRGDADSEEARDPRTGHDHDEHHAHDVENVSIAVVTVSSTRDHGQDPAGDGIQEALVSGGHEVVIRELVRDDYDGIQSTVDRLADRDDVECVITTGGTGVSPDDITIEAVDPLLDRTLPGFGELFRHLSRDEIGSRVVATRAMGGIVGGVPVFCLPGSANAAQLGTTEIIAPEVGHLVGLARR